MPVVSIHLYSCFFFMVKDVKTMLYSCPSIKKSGLCGLCGLSENNIPVKERIGVGGSRLGQSG